MSATGGSAHPVLESTWASHTASAASASVVVDKWQASPHTAEASFGKLHKPLFMGDHGAEHSQRFLLLLADEAKKLIARRRHEDGEEQEEEPVKQTDHSALQPNVSAGRLMLSLHNLLTECIADQARLVEVTMLRNPDERNALVVSQSICSKMQKISNAAAVLHCKFYQSNPYQTSSIQDGICKTLRWIGRRCEHLLKKLNLLEKATPNGSLDLSIKKANMRGKPGPAKQRDNLARYLHEISTAQAVCSEAWEPCVAALALHLQACDVLRDLHKFCHPLHCRGCGGLETRWDTLNIDVPEQVCDDEVSSGGGRPDEGKQPEGASANITAQGADRQESDITSAETTSPVLSCCDQMCGVRWQPGEALDKAWRTRELLHNMSKFASVAQTGPLASADDVRTLKAGRSAEIKCVQEGAVICTMDVIFATQSNKKGQSLVFCFAHQAWLCLRTFKSLHDKKSSDDGSDEVVDLCLDGQDCVPARFSFASTLMNLVAFQVQGSALNEALEVPTTHALRHASLHESKVGPILSSLKAHVDSAVEFSKKKCVVDGQTDFKLEDVAAGSASTHRETAYTKHAIAVHFAKKLAEKEDVLSQMQSAAHAAASETLQAAPNSALQKQIKKADKTLQAFLKAASRCYDACQSANEAFKQLQLSTETVSVVQERCQQMEESFAPLLLLSERSVPDSFLYATSDFDGTTCSHHLDVLHPQLLLNVRKAVQQKSDLSKVPNFVYGAYMQLHRANHTTLATSPFTQNQCYTHMYKLLASVHGAQPETAAIVVCCAVSLAAHGRSVISPGASSEDVSASMSEEAVTHMEDSLSSMFTGFTQLQAQEGGAKSSFASALWQHCFQSQDQKQLLSYLRIPSSQVQDDFLGVFGRDKTSHDSLAFLRCFENMASFVANNQPELQRPGGTIFKTTFTACCKNAFAAVWALVYGQRSWLGLPLPGCWNTRGTDEASVKKMYTGSAAMSTNSSHLVQSEGRVFEVQFEHSDLPFAILESTAASSFSTHSVKMVACHHPLLCESSAGKNVYTSTPVQSDVSHCCARPSHLQMLPDYINSLHTSLQQSFGKMWHLLDVNERQEQLKTFYALRFRHGISVPLLPGRPQVHAHGLQHVQLEEPSISHPMSGRGLQYAAATPHLVRKRAIGSSAGGHAGRDAGLQTAPVTTASGAGSPTGGDSS